MNNQKVVRHKEISTFVLVICVITALCISIPVLLQIKATDLYLNGSINTQVFSNIGGFLAGSVGIIFTFGGLFFLYLTLKAQREMFIEQQKFVKKQQEVLEQQRFETTFFNMLNLLKKIQEDITFKSMILIENKPKDLSFKGRDGFEKFFEDLNGRFNNSFGSEINDEILRNMSLEEYSKFLNQIYVEFFEIYHNTLGAYFRLIFNIFKFVIHEVAETEQIKYFNILQAQFSSYELSLILYDSISKYAGSKFRIWLDKQGFLENISWDCLLNPELDFKLFPNTKFKYRVFNENRDNSKDE